MKINKKYLNILLIILTSNILISQAEYQILTLSKDTFQLSSNNGFSTRQNSYSFINPASYSLNNINYGFSLIEYPAQIKMFNFHINNYSMTILNYGMLKDQLNNTINKTFYPQEILFQYILFR